ncbi:Metallo-beta-lactamase superfamily protein [Geodermatophilus siccatus]|uniref:Metallo-beta-lactamase superfamily protein n=1 Tax=Geodermatophilus siccatus TaxID=1137991 RepID=A0A1G9QIV9_9ACTN|nr:MBL fold metallo-hydrolase [Geodermatophilus siccatus]SDM10437.1 Metallo-beta-lactamase superfamily protein [Geodermatophilus siccatus]
MPTADEAGLTIEALPVRQGDCTLVTWGPHTDRHRMLIDAGPVPAYPAVHRRMSRLEPAERHLDVVVVTHVDADHIEGVLRLLNDASLGLTVGDVWFNGYQHLPSDDFLGPVHGEMLGALLDERHLPWNARFDGAAVSRARGAPPAEVELDGGLRVTVLAPSDRELAALRPVWERECRRAGLVAGSSRDALPRLQRTKKYNPLDSYLDPGDALAELADTPTADDDSEANASSITLLLELDGGSALLAADATPTALSSGLEALSARRTGPTLAVDVLKLPHHGSSRNVTADVLRAVPAGTYLVSTDGSYFGHPHDIAMARVLTYGSSGGTLAFNHRTATTEEWSATGRSVGFGAVLPDEPADGVRLEV